MAAGFISEPGSEYGPCATKCSHVDCQQSRSMAEHVCDICGKAIGYGRRFYDESGSGTHRLVHAVCLEEQMEAVAQ